MEEDLNLACEKETLDQTKVFLAAWRKFSPQDKPPNTDFLQFCGCNGSSSSTEKIFERLSSCHERLQHAIDVVKTEGFVFKWLTEVVSVKELNERDLQVQKVVNFFYPSPILDPPLCSPPVETSSITESELIPECEISHDVPHGETSYNLNDGSSKTISEMVDVKMMHPTQDTFDGSDKLAINNSQEMSEVNTCKLFSTENNEFNEKESWLHDDDNAEESNKLLANNNAEERDEQAESQIILSDGRIPTDSCSKSEETMDEKPQESNSLYKDKQTGVKNRTLPSVLTPLAKGINKARSKGRWYSPSNSKHRRSDSGSSATSVELETENDKSEDHDREVLLDSSETCDIYSTNQGNMAADGNSVCSDVNSCVDQSHGVDFTRRGVSRNKGRTSDGKSVEDRCEESTYDSPDVIPHVVEDLITYLEGVEVVSSDECETITEGESPEDPVEGNDQLMLFGGVIRPRKPFRKQLDSVMSVGNVSVLSSDSFVSNFAIDVAACEMQSADSSGDEGHEEREARPRPEVSPGLPCKVPEKEQNASPPPPVRPPRRSKTERSSRTLQSPKRVAAITADDDEVFGKGFEGDDSVLLRSSEVTHLRQRSPSPGVHRRSHSSDSDDLKKLRKARGSHVVIGGSNVDFSLSPMTSLAGGPSKQPFQESSDDDKAEKLHKRKWVVASVLDDERQYLECLNMLSKIMKPLKLSIESSAPILTVLDYNKIFHKLKELHIMHTAFCSDLEMRVSHWTDRHLVGDLFTSLVDQFDLYQEYILNYNTALSTIHKCKSSNEQFNNIFSKELTVPSVQEMTTLEGLLSKPMKRIGKYNCDLGKLIQATPEDHADFELLKSVLKSTEQFLARVSGDDRDGKASQRVKSDHRLLKDGFIVELADGVRKFRHLFLFNDYLLCTKRKITGRSEQYVSKWYIPVCELQFHPSEISEAPQTVPVTSKADFDIMKSRIASTKAEIRREEGSTSLLHSPDSSPLSKRRRAQSASKVVEKMKKRQAELEAALLLAIPSLPLTLYHKQGKTYTLLCKSDAEKAEWKEAILSLLKQSEDEPPIESTPLSVIELHHLLEACKKLRTCRTLGRVSFKEDKGLLNGVLYVHIQSGRGFHKNDLSCVVEVDHFGQFLRKAKTKTCKATTDPVWEQGFDVEVEGTRELKLHVYCKSRLNRDEHLAQGKIELLKENLTDLKKRTITISLDKQGAVTLLLQYSKTLQGIQRKKSLTEKGVFGVDIAKVSSRENSDIPLIVIGCVQEIEKRGMDEVGIYRLSGATSEVRKLKEAFDNNSQSALVQVAEADIHAVAGLLKMYLRDLPEPLFTDECYPKFVEASCIKEPEEKKKAMMEIFETLPTPNRLTSVYLLVHLRRVSEHQEQNKMGQNNLATVFGPNILRPSSSSSADPADLAQGTLDVMMQVSIFLWFLKCASVQLPSDPNLLHRLAPRKPPEIVIAPAPTEEQPDRLI